MEALEVALAEGAGGADRAMSPADATELSSLVSDLGAFLAAPVSFDDRKLLAKLNGLLDRAAFDADERARYPDPWLEFRADLSQDLASLAKALKQANYYAGELAGVIRKSKPALERLGRGNS